LTSCRDIPGEACATVMSRDTKKRAILLNIHLLFL
jgi:hypothetical protein